MTGIPLLDRIVATFITAVSVVGAMGLLGLDVLWLLGETVPVTGRQLVERQIAPLVACGLIALVVWTGRRDRPQGESQQRINKT